MFDKFFETVLCGLKLHNWIYTSKHRHCLRCGLWQEKAYDMSNGGTYYVDSIGTCSIYPFEKLANSLTKGLLKKDIHEH